MKAWKIIDEENKVFYICYAKTISEAKTQALKTEMFTDWGWIDLKVVRFKKMDKFYSKEQGKVVYETGAFMSKKGN